MKTSIIHELYKIRQQHILAYSSIVLLLLMLYTALPTAYITKQTVAQGFGINQWVIIIMIAISSNIVTMEYRDNTMSTLLYRNSNKVFPFLAKMITLLITGISLLIISTLFSFILKFLLAHKYSWSLLLNHHSLLTNFLAGLAGSVVYLLFTITLSLLLVVLTRSNAVVIITGLAIGFLGADLSAVLMHGLPGISGLIAWNPLNMINVISPFANTVSRVGLTTSQLIWGNLIYSVIFSLLGIYAFKHARV